VWSLAIAIEFGRSHQQERVNFAMNNHRERFRKIAATITDRKQAAALLRQNCIEKLDRVVRPMIAQASKELGREGINFGAGGKSSPCIEVYGANGDGGTLQFECRGNSFEITITLGQRVLSADSIPIEEINEDLVAGKIETFFTEVFDLPR
jgi:hypothetical protein